MNSSHQNNLTSTPQDLELLKDGVRLVSITFGITLYTNRLLSEISQSVLECYDKFFEICPKENLRFYGTENMRKHKPISKRTFNMLPTWLKPDAPAREYIYLNLKDGEKYQDAPEYKFSVCGSEKSSISYNKNANLISMAFPVWWGLEKGEEMLSFVKDLCSLFPYHSGHAGFSFECSEYSDMRSQTHAWEKSMRYRGIDISRIPQDARAVGRGAIKGVGWLTLLGNTFIAELGGLKKIRDQLSSEVEIIEVPDGVIFKAGPRPGFGDINNGEYLPLYREVHKVIASFVEVASEQSLSFSILMDYVEKKKAWYRRFSDEF